MNMVTIRRAITLVALSFLMSQPVQTVHAQDPTAPTAADSSSSESDMLAAWENYLEGFPPGEVDGWDSFTQFGHWMIAWTDEFGPNGNNPGGMTEAEATDLFLSTILEVGD